MERFFYVIDKHWCAICNGNCKSFLVDLIIQKTLAKGVS